MRPVPQYLSSASWDWWKLMSSWCWLSGSSSSCASPSVLLQGAAAPVQGSGSDTAPLSPQWGFDLLKLIPSWDLVQEGENPWDISLHIKFIIPYAFRLSFNGMSLSNSVIWLITSKMLVAEGRRLPSCTSWGLLPRVSLLVVCVGIHSVFASFWEVTVSWATRSSVLELKYNVISRMSAVLTKLDITRKNKVCIHRP